MNDKSKQSFTKQLSQSPGRTARVIVLGFGLFALGALLLRDDLFVTNAARGLRSLLAKPARLSSGQKERISPEGLWQTESAPVSTLAEGKSLLPSKGTFRLNREALAQMLAQAPMEFTEAARNSPIVMSLPMPDGQFARFSVVESPIMAPELAKKFPNIKTYSGRGIDDPTATVRFDWTPPGFHAMVLSEHKTVFVDPTADGEIENYKSLTKDDLPRENFTDAVVEDASKIDRESSNAQGREPDTVRPAVTNGAKLRVYRMAVAATFEYTTAAGGTKAGALARITTTMNRLNGIFEREIAIRMVLIADENKIIFDTAAQSPYKDGD